MGLKKTKKLSKTGDLKFSTESEHRMDVGMLIDSFNDLMRLNPKRRTTKPM